MGGLGSTRWSWVSTRDTVEGSRSLDINKLNKAGCLRPGYWGGWEWKRDGERVAWIEFRRDEDRLVLSYRVRRHVGEWQEVEQPTRIVWTSCRFGGTRPYFVCPGSVNGIDCCRRVTKLYGAGTYFLCRHCCRLAYASQREDRYDRALRQANASPSSRPTMIARGGVFSMCSPRRAKTGAAKVIGLVAPTANDVRKVMVEGPAGILAVSPPWFRPVFEPGNKRLIWPNGAYATTFSADEPDRLRGPVLERW
jgi:hypothetical protein